MRIIIVVYASCLLLISGFHTSYSEFKSHQPPFSSNSVNLEGILQKKILLIQQLIDSKKYQQAVEHCRQILEQNPEAKMEQQSSFLLGKALLLKGERQLAELTLKDLNARWPSNPHREEADFLQIKTALAGLTRTADFENAVKHILKFSPFNIDLDYFQYFTGFTRGYQIKKIRKSQNLLAKYFNSKDMALRSRAVLLDGLIQCFDFANLEAGIPKLKQLAQVQEIYINHTARLGLLIIEGSRQIENLQALEAWIPENAASSEPGRIALFTLAMVQAYIHGEYAPATSKLQLISKSDAAFAPQKIQEHLQVLKVLQTEPTNASETLQRAQIFKQYSSYHEAVNVLQSSLKRWPSSRLRGRIHYELGRLYQDDIKDAGLARFHLEKSQRHLKTEEFSEEVKWRLIKTLAKEKQQAEVFKLANKDLPFSEAAIRQQLKNRQISPSLLDQYYRSLLKLELDPSNQALMLKRLSEVAEQNHQYLKSRFYLMRLARYQMSEANQRIQENLWKEEIFKATQKKLVSSEPEKFQYLQARYLNLLGNSEEATEHLNQLVKSKGLFAEKAKFELFITDLEAAPYPEDQVFELKKWIESNLDDETNEESFERLVRHYEIQLKDFLQQDPVNQKYAKQTLIPAYNKLLIEQKPVPGISLKSIENAKTRLLIYTGQWNAADKQIKRLRDRQDQLHFQLKIAELQYNLPRVVELALLIHKESDKESVQIQVLQRALNTELAIVRESNPDNSTSEAEIIEKYFNLARKTEQIHMIPFVLQQIEKIPSSLTLLDIIIRHKDPLISNPPKGLNSALKSLQKEFPTNIAVIKFRLELMERYPSRLAQKFLLEQTKSGRPEIRLIALRALAKDHLQSLNNAGDIPFRSYLIRRIETSLNGITNTDWRQIEELIRFHWVLNEQKDIQRKISSQIKNSNVFLSEFARLEYLKLLIKHKRSKMITETLAKIMNNSMLPEGFRFHTFETVYLNLEKSRILTTLNRWLFKIDERLLTREERNRFRKIKKRLNAEAVVISLKKQIDWDDPQSLKNKRIFLEMLDQYQKELEDMNAAMDLIHQMRQYYSDSDLKANLNRRLIKLSKMQEALAMESSQDPIQNLLAAELWLEGLRRPYRAFQVLDEIEIKTLTPAQQHFHHLLIIRSLIQKRQLSKAQKWIQRLPKEFKHFHVALISQMEARKKLQKYPTVTKANLSQLIEIAQIQLHDFMNLAEVDRLIYRINKYHSEEDFSKYPQLSKLYLDYYNIAMGKNTPNLASNRLMMAVEQAPNKKIRARAFYLLGNHYSNFQLNPKKAEMYFKACLKNDPDETDAILTHLGLANLYESRNMKRLALNQYEALKVLILNPQSSDYVAARELQLKKSLVVQKLEDELSAELAQHPDKILLTARSLADNNELTDQAIQRYSLYFRLQRDLSKINPVRMELAELLERRSRLNEALELYLKVFKEDKDQATKVKAGMKALSLQGLKRKNFNSSFKLIGEIRRLLLNPDQNSELDKLKAKIVQLKKKQKRITLRNLSYNHFPQIRQIKKNLYKKNKNDEAARSLESILKKADDYQLIVGVHYELARLYDLKLKQYKKALLHYQKFYEKMDNPDISSEILLRIAEIELKEFNNIEDALASYNRYLSDFPAAQKRLSVMFQIAELYTNKRFEYSRALETYEDISNAYPQTPWDEKAKFSRAELLSNRMSDFDAAIQVYRNLININFESKLAPEAQYRIGSIYELQLNDDLQAIQAYDELIARYPNSSYAVQARRQIDKIRRR